MSLFIKLHLIPQQYTNSISIIKNQNRVSPDYLLMRTIICIFKKGVWCILASQILIRITVFLLAIVLFILSLS